MTLCEEIIESTIKNYVPEDFSSLDMSEVTDIEDSFSVICEGMIERLLEGALEATKDKINSKGKERIQHFFRSVEEEFEDREESLKRLTLCYALASNGQGSLMGWKRYMLNHSKINLKEINEIYFSYIQNNHKEMIGYGS